MIYIDTNLRPLTLTRVWLQTTDRKAPLRAVWIDASAAAPAAPAAFSTDAGGAPLCA